MVVKIISGGQTGVDRGALKAALKLGIETGGWCPPGREANDGIIPDIFQLKETPFERSPNAPDIPRSLRTEWNVRDADATLIFAPEELLENDKGTYLTKTCADKMNKPVFVSNPFKKDIQSIKLWLEKNKPTILNVAGPSEEAFPGIVAQTETLLLELLG